MAPVLWRPFEPDGSPRPRLSVWAGDGFAELDWDRWRREALGVAAGLRSRGVRGGARVACVLTNSPGSCATVLGVWLAGGSVVSMPTPARGLAPDAYVEQLRVICAQAQPIIVAVDGSSAARALESAGLAPAVAAFEDLPRDTACDPEPGGANDEVFVQYSSGSTTEPRGCVLTAGAIARQLDALTTALDVDAERDVAVSWLPLSHDMGLFGCLLVAYWTGIRLVLSSPERFLREPSSWFADCARVGATMTVAPNFAYDLAARAAPRKMPGPFPMRRAVIGGERVEPATLERLTAALGGERFPWTSLTPAYGLAEAVLAVTVTPPGEGPRILDDGQRRLVSVGRPVPGTTVRIADRGDGPEIVVRSGSLASGYLADQRATARVFADGELRTGDLGLLEHGELFVSGRLDDMLSVAGRNVFARDIEAAMAEVGGLRAGSCALVDVTREGRTAFAVVAEANGDTTDSALEEIARELRRVARRRAGVRVEECHFVPRGALPKTPSGKVQRFRCRALVLDPPTGSYIVALGDR